MEKISTKDWNEDFAQIVLNHMMLEDSVYVGALFATLYTAWSYSGFSHLTKAASA